VSITSNTKANYTMHFFACFSKYTRRAALGFTAAAVGFLPLIAFAQIGRTELLLNSIPVAVVYPTGVISKKTALGAFEIDVAIDAPIAAGASRNLIVMSHGAGGSMLSDHTMAAHFVQAGFIVAQPLHAGDNYRDSSKSGPASWATRPGEISAVIDGLAGHPQWRMAIKFDRVGVHGMSAGGATALSLAGGQWRMLALIQHCNANPDSDLGFCFNGISDPAAQAQRKAQYASAKGVPEMFLPASLKLFYGGKDAEENPRPDMRIAAVSVNVPVAAIFSEASLARIKIPVGVVAAEADTMLKPQFHSEYLLKHCKACALLDNVPGASHLDMLHPWPTDIAAQTSRTQPYGAELNLKFDHARRLEAYARVVAFHRKHLME
jgi:predicted dienelactone hydrolase